MAFKRPKSFQFSIHRTNPIKVTSIFKEQGREKRKNAAIVNLFYFLYFLSCFSGTLILFTFNHLILTYSIMNKDIKNHNFPDNITNQLKFFENILSYVSASFFQIH